MIALADAVGSTTGIIQAAERLGAKEYIVATDGGIIHQMRKRLPGVTFIEAPTAGKGATCQSCAHCPWMAMNGLHNLLETLEGAPGHEVHVDPADRPRAPRFRSSACSSSRSAYLPDDAGQRGRVMRIAGAAAATIAALALAVPARATPAEAARLERELTTARPGTIGAPFTLRDPAGRHRTLASFRGKVVVLYFGFTFCPDVCPTDLQQIARALQLVGRAARDVQVLFVTLDPARDTPKLLAQYTSAFHPRILALRAGEDEVLRVARDFTHLRAARAARRGWLRHRARRLHAAARPRRRVPRLHRAGHASRADGGDDRGAARGHPLSRLPLPPALAWRKQG